MKKRFLFIGMTIIAVGILFILSRVLQQGNSLHPVAIHHPVSVPNQGSGEMKAPDVQLANYAGDPFCG